MTKVYRITPLEKKNAEILYDVFEEMEDGSTRSWHIEELYRWGLGFRHVDNPVTEWEVNSKAITCDTDAGYGAELDDLINVSFNFDENFTEEEKDELKNLWYEGGAGWLYDGDHSWQVDYDSLTIYGSVKIDLIDDSTLEIFEEKVWRYLISHPKTPVQAKTIAKEWIASEGKVARTLKKFVDSGVSAPRLELPRFLAVSR